MLHINVYTYRYVYTFMLYTGIYIYVYSHTYIYIHLTILFKCINNHAGVSMFFFTEMTQLTLFALEAKLFNVTLPETDIALENGWLEY